MTKDLIIWIIFNEFRNKIFDQLYYLVEFEKNEFNQKLIVFMNSSYEILI